MAGWNIVSFCFLFLVLESRAGDVALYNSLTAFRNMASAISGIHDIETIQSKNVTRATDLTATCSRHRDFYQTSLMKPDTWALSMFDAGTKIPEGILFGTFTQLGNFDECIKIRDIAHTDGSIFHGKHCLATISMQLSSKSGATTPRTPLRTAVCVPSTCNADDVGIIAAEDMKKMLQAAPPAIGMFVQIEAAGDDLYCHTLEKPDFQTSDWIAVVIYAIFGVAVVLSTAYDLLTTKSEKRSNLLLAFSAYTNGKRLLASSSGSDNLGCVHGIRFISIAWIVLGHRYMDGLTAPYINILEFMMELFPKFRYLYITNSQLAVDTFFVLSGLLVAYVFFRTVPKTNSFNIPMYYIHRYLRLTPALAAVVLLNATLMSYAGSGPLWEGTVKPTREKCENNWWATLLYIQNFYESANQCLGQAWYLSVDMQLYWLSPLVLIPLWKFPKVGWIVMAGLSVGGIIANFLISYINEFAGSHLSALINNTSTYSKLYYYPTYCRFIPYLIGIALGYILVDLKSKGRTVKYSKIVTCSLWLIIAFIMTFTLCIVHIFQQTDYEYEPVGPAFYNSLGRPVWALGMAMFIYLCVTGHGGFINSLLSWEGFQPLGRLSYGIYLIHMNLQTSLSASTRTLWYLADITLMPAFFADLVISIFLAAVLCLVFESPFIILEKELLGGKKKPSSSLPVASVSRLDEREQTADKSENVEQGDEFVQVQVGSKTEG